MLVDLFLGIQFLRIHFSLEIFYRFFLLVQLAFFLGYFRHKLLNLPSFLLQKHIMVVGGEFCLLELLLNFLQLSLTLTLFLRTDSGHCISLFLQARLKSFYQVQILHFFKLQVLDASFFGQNLLLSLVVHRSHIAQLKFKRSDFFRESSGLRCS